MQVKDNIKTIVIGVDGTEQHPVDDFKIDDFNYWYIVNLSQKIVVKMRSEEAEKFVADMDSVDIGYCKVNRK